MKKRKNVDVVILKRAKALRSNQTDAEQRLWYYLRAQRFMNMKFKRQEPVGRYIVDFICYEHNLVIELDGGQHQNQSLTTKKEIVTYVAKATKF